MAIESNDVAFQTERPWAHRTEVEHRPAAWIGGPSQRPSHYNRVRREPRREALSTIEAAALLLRRIEGRPEIEAALNGVLERLIAETGSPARTQGHGRVAR